MVVFKADEIYFSNSMKEMNKLRRDQSFCDVRLIIGDNTVYAHKCVLTAGSPYFRSLFLGKFTESLMDDINLSEVTDSVESLELILDFVYTGEIDIDYNNLGIIVKLSSFFLVESLRNFCIAFMKDSLCLKTCLQYYWYSLDYGLQDIERKALQMVQARFHDYLIFQDDTLNITPDELLHLVNSSLLHHCSSLNLLKFIADWVGRGLTERHISLGTEFLDIVNCKEHGFVSFEGPIQYSLQYTFDRVLSKLEKVSLDGQDKFVRRFRQILVKSSVQKHLETKNYNLRVPTSPRSKLASELKMKAVFCLTPRPHIVEAFEKRNFGKHVHEQIMRPGEPVTDLLAYLPKTETWYKMDEFSQEIETISCLADEMLWGLWHMEVFQDQLVFLNYIIEEMNMYNLRTKCWTMKSFGSQIELLLADNEYTTDFCFTSSADGTLYLISKLRIIAEDGDGEPRNIKFRGFLLYSGSQTWHPIFETENFDLSAGENTIPEMHAKVSTTSNELLFTYVRQENQVDGWNMAFVVDLSCEGSYKTCVKLLATYQTNGQMLFREIGILEGKKHFFIVSNGTSPSGGKVQVKYEYKYRSHDLVERNSTEMHISVIEPGFHTARNANNDVYPCWSEVSTVDRDTLWYIEGNLDKVSSFAEVTLNRSKNPVVKRHPPPPFTCVTAIWVGDVSTDILKGMWPVAKFPYAN